MLGHFIYTLFKNERGWIPCFLCSIHPWWLVSKVLTLWRPNQLVLVIYLLALQVSELLHSLLFRNVLRFLLSHISGLELFETIRIRVNHTRIILDFEVRDWDSPGINRKSVSCPTFHVHHDHWGDNERIPIWCVPNNPLTCRPDWFYFSHDLLGDTKFRYSVVICIFNAYNQFP